MGISRCCPIPPSTGSRSSAPSAAPIWSRTLSVEDRQQRNANIRKLYGILGDVTVHRTTAEWLAICERLDIPATALTALDELPAHPQLQAVGFFRDDTHPTEGPIRTVRPTTKFAASPAGVRVLAPRLGRHSRALLAEAGYGEAEIDALILSGTVIQDRERN